MATRRLTAVREALWLMGPAAALAAAAAAALSFERTAGFTGSGVLACALALGAGMWLGRAVALRPLGRLVRAARLLADGDLAARAVDADDLGGPAGDLVRWIHRIAENQRELVARLQAAAEGLDAHVPRAGAATHALARGAEVALAEVDAASRRGARLAEQVTVASAVLDELQAAAQRARLDGGGEWGDTAAQVAEQAEGAAVAAEQLAAGLQELSRVAEAVAAGAAEAGGAESLSEKGFAEVGEAAEAASRACGEVGREAEAAAARLSRALVGLGRVRSASAEARGAVEALARRASAMGGVGRAMEELAELTDLLALNAAIAAGQAGGAGGGAGAGGPQLGDELRDLAERAAASSREAQDVTRELQENAAAATAAVRGAGEALDEGAQAGAEARDDLDRLVEVARRASGAGAQASRAAADRSLQARRGAGEARRFAHTAAELGRIAAEQHQRTQAMRRAAEEARRLARDLERREADRKRAAGESAAALARVNESAGQLRVRRDEELRDARELVSAVEKLRDAASAQGRGAQELDRALEAIALRAEELRNEARRYRAR
jgi:methyl-accepting chemotaxis protein